MDTKTKRQTTGRAEESAIRSLLDDWAAAHRAKDAGRMMAHYAERNVQFILAPPLQFSGENAWDQDAVAKWLSTFKGPIEYDMRDVEIAAGDDVAFCHFLSRLGATPAEPIHSPDGEVYSGSFEMWSRVTLGLRKIDGRWLVTHVHSSVPFYMDGSFRAAVDLQP